MGYENKYDLMDKSIFPQDSIFLTKENPKSVISTPISRVDKTDEEIIAAVSKNMAKTLGVKLEP